MHCYFIFSGCIFCALFQIVLVGLVRSSSETSTRLDYLIDDMTGAPLEVRQFVDNDVMLHNLFLMSFCHFALYRCLLFSPIASLFLLHWCALELVPERVLVLFRAGAICRFGPVSEHFLFRSRNMWSIFARYLAYNIVMLLLIQPLNIIYFQGV